MTEADLRANLVKKLRAAQPTWVVLRHEDHYTTGVPDISVTGNGRTSWWETKRVAGDARPQEKELKLRQMQRLAHNGFARYIIYRERPRDNSVHIITPEAFPLWPFSGAEHTWWDGFDHRAVVAYIVGAHQS